MPKRKRDTNEYDGHRTHSMREKDISEKLAQSKKLLHRALKTAKGFERQKLSKRLKHATTQKDEKNIARINREIEALKGLDLDTATNAYLYRNILKVKAFAESEFCPEEVKREVKRPDAEEEALVALHNVTSNMYNAAVVKECMNGIMNGLYIAFGIPAPVGKRKGELKKEHGKDKVKDAVVGVSMRPEEEEEEEEEEKENIEVEREDMKTKSEEDPSTWEGLDSEDEHQDEEKIEAENEDDFDEQELSRYDALIGASSDEESFDEEEYAINRPAQASKRLSLSLSPTPSNSPSPSPTVSLSPEPVPPTSKPSKPTKLPKTKPLPAKAGLSTFLPTLMGGYWSGSESSASDLEDHGAASAPVRKNRPGQMARRAIWEKKFGDKANHIKTGQGPVAKSKDDGWDAKRGARESGERDGFSGRGRGGGFGGRGGGRQRNYSQVTGENAIEVGPRKRGMAKKDDVGVLHPSWQAAKKAKEMKKTATFQGKKVTFD